MCRIDYADNDGIWMQAPKERRALKVHKCDDCGRTIAKGEKYTYGAYIYDGDFNVVKMCAHCIAAGHWLQAVCGGHLYPGVVEELTEHWDEEYDLRSVGLGRLVRCAERRWHRRSRSDELVPVEDVRRWCEEAIARVPDGALH